MTLILQIAVGMLLGYILIENRHSLLNLMGGILALGGVALVCAAVVTLLWYVGDQAITAAGSYESAGELGRKVFFGIQFVLFAVLGISMFAGIYVFAALLVPKAFVRLCTRLKNPRTPLAFVTISIAVVTFVAGSQIVLPHPFSRWETSWLEYGLSHGMGYDGRTTYYMLLWQIIWAINYLLFKVRGTNPFNDTAAIFGTQDPAEPSP